MVARLTLTEPGRAPFHAFERNPSGTEVEIELPLEGVVMGRVVDEHGSPANVRVNHDRVDDEGRFRFAGLLPGPFAVEVVGSPAWLEVPLRISAKFDDGTAFVREVAPRPGAETVTVAR